MTLKRQAMTLKDKAFMDVARAMAQLGTCPRRQVGAVIVKDNRIVSTGYNGACAGMEHCGCEIEHGHCITAVHAELNAVIQAGYARANGGTIYTTASPCRACMGAIINAGLKRVVYSEVYQDPTHEGDKAAWALGAAVKVGVEMCRLVGGA